MDAVKKELVRSRINGMGLLFAAATMIKNRFTYNNVYVTINADRKAVCPHTGELDKECEVLEAKVIPFDDVPDSIIEDISKTIDVEILTEIYSDIYDMMNDQ